MALIRCCAAVAVGSSLCPDPRAASGLRWCLLTIVTVAAVVVLGRASVALWSAIRLSGADLGTSTDVLLSRTAPDCWWAASRGPWGFGLFRQVVRWVGTGGRGGGSVPVPRRLRRSGGTGCLAKRFILRSVSVAPPPSFSNS